MKKFLTCLVVLGLCIAGIAWAAVDLNEINFTNVTSGNLDRYLRNWFATVNQGSAMAEGFQARGTIYYVDGNKSSAGDGLSWSGAFNTLTAALAASHADMAVSARRKWAGRNTIFCMGDALTEDLVLLAQKTDVIGVGQNNPYNKCGLKGNHDIPSTTATPACRFYNFQFWGDEAAELWDVDNQAGLEFHDCIFQANALATVGLEASECSHLKVINCWFGSPDGQDFTSSAIEIPNDTIGGINILIEDNRIHSNDIGIDWDETTNVDCWIDGNKFFTGGMIIDSEDSTEIMVVNNVAVTLVAEADNTSYDFNVAYAANNVFTGSDQTNAVPKIVNNNE